MRVTERTLTLDECRGELFEPYQEPCFWDVLDCEFLMAKEIGHVVVLDLAGGLEGSEAQEFLGRIQRLIERGERTIVVNLGALTKVDSVLLGELVVSYGTLKRIGGAMPLVNAPKHFRQLVASMKFL